MWFHLKMLGISWIKRLATTEYWERPIWKNQSGLLLKKRKIKTSENKNMNL